MLSENIDKAMDAIRHKITTPALEQTMKQQSTLVVLVLKQVA